MAWEPIQVPESITLMAPRGLRDALGNTPVCDVTLQDLAAASEVPPLTLAVDCSRSFGERLDAVLSTPRVADAIRSLILMHGALPDAQWQRLTRLPALTKLCFHWCPRLTYAIPHPLLAQLTTLEVSGCLLSDAFAESLCEGRALTQLDLSCAEVPSRLWQRVVRQSTVRSLSMSDVTPFTRDDLEAIVGMASLRTLIVDAPRPLAPLACALASSPLEELGLLGRVPPHTAALLTSVAPRVRMWWHDSESS